MNVRIKCEVHSVPEIIAIYLKTSGSPWIHRSWLSKVIDFGTNQ